ncbi:MAG: M48 family metallopeptidase [Helicobacteraceae bacterium]|nr:M48 family metallopeptidase [Helicobacteraceae bacterium]
MGFVWFLVAFYAAYIVADLLLKLAQLGFVKKAREGEPSLLSGADWQKAADYEIVSLRFGIAQNLFDAAVQFGWLFAGFALLDRAIAIESQAPKSALFIALYITILIALNQPFQYYKTFVIDEKFGFNRSTKKLYFIDLIKSVALAFPISFAIAYAFVAVLGLYADSFGEFDNALKLALGLFAVAMFFIVLANLLFPYFAKLFNKFEPIDDTPLGAKIGSLLKRAGFGAKGVFKIDAGKRDSRLNAYFAGFGKTKRVALYDALIEKLSEEEILAVLGHELGHFKHKDIFKQMGALSAEILIFCLLLAAAIGVDFYAALGLPKAPHFTLVIYAVFILSPLSFFLQPIINAISRRAEFAADSYGASLTDKTYLKSALIKLVVENRAFPKKRPIYALWNETHPSVLTRIERLS